MIVRNDKENYVFITQHDHAYIAGEFLAHFKKEFIPIDHFESLKFAIHQHDRAWIVPDSNPLINDLTSLPYTFLDYPERLKLHFYKLGIDQVDLANSYAAILCSMHYASLYKDTTNPDGKQFYDREKLRQKHLMSKLKIQNEDLLSYQLRILQFCDDLSLYICLNKPGIEKKDEIKLYRNGFKNSAFFHQRSDYRIIAFFKDKDRNNVDFNSSPFDKPFEIKLPIKRIEKALIKDLGIEAAYQHSDLININYKFH